MKFIVKKIKNAIKHPMEASSTLRNIIKKNLRKLHPIELSDEEFLEILGCKAADHIRGKTLHHFFLDPANKNRTIETIKNRSPLTIQETVDDADDICDGVFDLLGSGKTKLKKLDWHCDFKSGFFWDPEEYYLGSYKHMDYLDQGIHADIKVPWELSRFQHLPTLGKAYWYTTHPKYAEEFAEQITDWIRANPIELGVNWVSTMDVAIRVVNWIWAYYFFYDSPDLTNKFRVEFLRNLFLHGRHILNHLELETRNNHYLSNLVGLVYLGIFFQETEEGREWLDNGISLLKKEMEFQVYHDGVSFESSTSYHRLAAELFISATILCQKNGIDFPKWYMDRLEKMIEFVRYYTKPDGSVPQIGDADNGRLHILSHYGNWDKTDHRYLLSVGASFFNRPDFHYQEFDEEAFWILGEDLKDFENIKRYDIESKSFNVGGFYIMRDKDLYLLVDCISPPDNAPQGHRHNDALSLEIFTYDRSFIIDPGSYTYTADPKMRNLFRSSKYHNLVQVDHEEQNKYDEGNLFKMGRDARVKVNQWEVGEDHDFLDAEHQGYLRLEKPVIHKRQVYFDKKRKYWMIKDTLEGEGRHRFDLYFHFAPLKLKYYKDSPYIITTDLEDGANLMIIPTETEGLSVEVVEGWVSYSYGEKIRAPVVKHSKYAEAPTEFRNLIYPYRIRDEADEFLKNLREEDY